MDTTEDRRVIDLYKYYNAETDRVRTQIDPKTQGPHDAKTTQPLPKQGVTVLQQTTPDGTLTAFCQLAALRLGVQRAGISLVGRHQQYILAESTPTLDLAIGPAQNVVSEPLRMGWNESSRRGGLCEKTIKLPPARLGEVPCFTVRDLSRDERFNTAPFVTRVPHLELYCGTPITTSRSMNIGSFWVVDTRDLEEFSSDKKQFMGTIASLIMKQLEMDQVAVARRRIVRMSKALSYFVDGKMSLSDTAESRSATSIELLASLEAKPLSLVRQTQPPEPEQAQDESIHKAGVQPNGDASTSQLGLQTQSSQDTDYSMESAEASSPGPSRSGNVEDTNSPNNQYESDGRALTFARAMNLMREAFDIQGCVVYDLSVGYLSGLGSDFESDDSTEPEPNHSDRRDLSKFHARQTKNNHKKDRPGVKPSLSFQGGGPSASQGADVLAFAVEDSSSLDGDRVESAGEFNAVSQKFLIKITRRYPSGGMWSFGQHGLLSSSDDPNEIVKDRTRKRRRQSEADILQRVFPGISQLLFCPLFDNSLGRATAACFCFTTSMARILSPDPELVFLKGYLDNVGAQLSKLDAIAADKSKTDFIGSISHELRSPLHGILAAAEFLEDTQLNSFQKSLIRTQVSCGKTLLDVIEHVLDFAKINSLRNDARNARRTRGQNLNDSGPYQANIQNLVAFTDIAELAEEVVEGSAAGRSRSNNYDYIMRKPRGPRASVMHQDDGENAVEDFAKTEALFRRGGKVAVIVDIDYQQDWVYTTQPGAIRRILMNVWGNALKYTPSGYVHARLEAHDLDPSESQTVRGSGSQTTSMVTLVVTDTGKGISRDFLQSRLFRPFTQEDHLSTGCGLGLSIVRSLVDSLHGKLEIQSELKVGTTVSVSLPLVRSPSEASKEAPTPETSVPQPRAISDSGLPLPEPGFSVAYIGFEVPDDSDAISGIQHEQQVRTLMRTAISRCLEGWLKMSPITESQTLNDADYVVVLVADERLLDFIKPYVDDVSLRQPRVIAVLEHEMSRSDAEFALGQSIKAFEVVSNCLGPRKLANAVASCEQAARDAQSSMRQPLVRTLPLRFGRNIEGLPESGTHEPDANHAGPPSDFAKPSSPRAEKDWSCDQPANGHKTGLHGPTSSDSPPSSDSPTSSVSPTSSDSLTSQVSPTSSDSLTSQVSPTSSNSLTSSVSHHVLLVDDNAINLKLLEVFMKRKGVQYDCANDGLVAVTNAQERKTGYDIIFMDISMPVMDGLEATRKIRTLEKRRHEEDGDSAPKPALIVALTGLASSRDRTNAFEAGVDHFITKPVKFREIGIIVDKWSGGRD